MIKKYRRRFVLYNMSLIALVILIMLVSIGFYLHSNYSSELEITMSQVLGPLDEPNGKFKSLLREKDNDGGERDDTEQDESRLEKPESKRFDDGLRNKQITSVFYNSSTGELFVMPDNNADTSSIASYIDEIISSEDDYGKLDDYGIIYYKTCVGETYKIALADTSYINGQMLITVMVLVGIFIVSLLVFFPISVVLSKLAAKPMEDAIEMERRFVADISHDLKTPITVILANNSILKGNADMTVADELQWIDSTGDSAKNMLAMINEMLTLSSLENGSISVTKENVDLSSIAQKAVLQMESVAYEREILIDGEIESDVFASATPEYASRICSSLIENAIKYEPDGGKVSVDLKNVKKSAVLTVKNHGSTILAQDLPHVFERFYRSDKSRGEKKGHGLGLSIVKRMTELIDAEITVTSSDKDGTVFEVKFESV